MALIKVKDSQGNWTVSPIIAKQDVYSTDEQIVGTWIDGKPLYRKVIEQVGSGTNLMYVPSSVFDVSVCKVRKMSVGMFTNDSFVALPRASFNGTTLNSNITTGSDSTGMFVQDTARVVSNVYTYRFIVEYTKTTD